MKNNSKMNNLSASATPFQPAYDKDFPPIERESPEVVKLRKELSSVRHQLVCSRAKVSDREFKLSQAKMRSDWLEHWKDKFKEKAEYAEEENKGLRETFNELTTEKLSLQATLEKKNKELSDMEESRIVLREDHELQISRNERHHQQKITEIKEDFDKNISVWIEKNRKLEAEVFKLKEDVECGRDAYNSLNDRYRSVLGEVRELRNTSAVNEEWIGRSLKLKWIFDEMLKIGAVKLPDHEWATDMVQEIEFPNGSNNSVFYEVPRNIRETYLPGVQDAHMEWIEEEDENELIQRLSEEASDFSNSVDNSLFASLERDRETTIKHITTIQKHIRGYLARLHLKKGIEDALLRISDEMTRHQHAITIQKYWRRFYSSPIRYQCYSALEEQAPGVIRSDPGNRELYSRSITLVNTGNIDYRYRYIIPGRGPGRENIIPALESQNISTYATHWFHISMKTPGSNGQTISRKIRIPIMLAHGVGSGYYGSRKWVFDVHTGICFHRHQWDALKVFDRTQRTIYVPNRPILLGSRSGDELLPPQSAGGRGQANRVGIGPITCNCERCIQVRFEREQILEMQEREIQENQEFERAIRLSLLEMEIDYTESLNNMFQEPEEIQINNEEEELETLYDNFVEWANRMYTDTYDDY